MNRTTQKEKKYLYANDIQTKLYPVHARWHRLVSLYSSPLNTNASPGNNERGNQKRTLTNGKMANPLGTQRLEEQCNGKAS